MAKKAKGSEKESDDAKKRCSGLNIVSKSHMKMIVWQSIDELDVMVQEILTKVPRNEYKMRSQIDNTSASVGANFVEGYYSGFLPEYIRFLTYSRRSLGELQERVRRVLRKGYIANPNTINSMSERVRQCT